MTRAYHMWQRIGRLRSITDWVEATGHTLLVLLYHHVGDEREWHKHLYKAISPVQFAADMDWLITHFRPVSQREVIAQIRLGVPFPEPVVWITFDDGLRSIADNALPVLAQRNIPSTMFVNPDFTRQTDIMYRMKMSVLLERLQADDNVSAREWAASQFPGNGSWQQRLLATSYANRGRLDQVADMVNIDWQAYAKTEQVYCTAEDLSALHGELVAIGAHSLDHPMLAELPKDAALHQVEGSMEWVQRHFGPESTAFAFPFTDQGLSTSFLTAIQGLPHAPELLLGTAGLKQEHNPGHIHRVAVDTVDAALVDQVGAAYAAARIKQCLGRYRVKR